MKVRENPGVVEKVMKKLRGRQRRPRQYSVTKLICCPRKTYYRMIGKKEVITDATQLLFARGRAHHGVLEVLPLREIRREKKAFNGMPIRGDIDMIGQRITEIFTTSLSSKKVRLPSDVIKVFPMKLKQLRAYCYFEGESEGDLLVFFLFGDYSRVVEVFGKKQYVGIRPVLRDWTFEFTEAELLEVWDLMNNNLAEIEQAKKDGIPPLATGEEWECNNCGYNHLCFGDEVVVPRSIDKVITGLMTKNREALL